ncbi:MAG: LytR family transcriptional regulator [Glaciihabitans sp.]|nr:LytR family transcriptional regulator [Glaciihabitans sp.]
MTKRAWILVLLGVVIPGSAQVLAGNRRLGRFGLATTLALWFLAIVAALVWFLARPFALGVATNGIALLIAQVLLAAYAVLWVVLALDTLRLTRLVKAAPRARGFIAGVAVILLVTTAGTAAYGSYVSGVARTTLAHVFGGTTYSDPVNGRYNILLLGGDAGADRTGLRPDSISVVSIDANTGATTIIGVPRNLQRAPFSKGSPMLGPFPNGYDCGVNCLVSFLYTYGQEHPTLYPDAVAHHSQPGIEAMRDAIQGVVGLKLQYYALIDMKGFQNLVDALGGITIEVKERLPINGGQDANGQPTQVYRWIEPGVQKMDGFTALWYARSRHGTSDYDRMARQRTVQAAILAQFDPGTVLTKFEAIAKASGQIVKTDIPQGMLGKFVDLASKARAQKLDNLELVPPLVDVIHPNFTDIHSLVAQHTAVSTPTPTP